MSPVDLSDSFHEQEGDNKSTRGIQMDKRSTIFIMYFNTPYQMSQEMRINVNIASSTSCVNCVITFESFPWKIKILTPAYP